MKPTPTTPPTPTPFKVTLRQLPIPVRLVLSAFLIAVGVGYLSAMVQLHFKEASPGNAIPGATEVVAIYSGKTFPRPIIPVTPVKPVSQLQHLIQAPESEPWSSSGSMSKAFTVKSEDWVKAEEATLRPLRAGEQLALVKWIEAGASKQHYETDAFPRPSEVVAITPEFLDETKSFIKVKSIFDARCVRCHSADGEQAQHPLEKYEDFKKYLVVRDVSGDPAKAKQITVEHLTQSTHLHLLSFSMLYMLTGTIFAFTSYPVWMRCILAPIVVTAAVIDVGFWWLARLDGIGPYFALGIMATGGIVGLGLLLQIILSLVNMYGAIGRSVLFALFLGGASLGGLATVKVILPQLAAEKVEAEKAKAEMKATTDEETAQKAIEENAEKPVKKAEPEEKPEPEPEAKADPKVDPDIEQLPTPRPSTKK